MTLLMKSLFNARRALVALIGMVGAGAVLWPIPYRDLSLIGPLFLAGWGAAGAAAGLLGQLIRRGNIARTAGWVAIGFCLAVMGRVLVEVIADPTDHNLWPFEVAVAAGVGFGSGLVGASAGWLVGRIRNKG